MNCRQAGDILIDLLDGELDGPSRAELLDHLASCPTCVAEYAALRRVRSALGLLAGQAPPMRMPVLADEPVAPSFSGRRSGDRATDHRPSAARRRFWRLAVGAAAAAAIIMAAALLLTHEQIVPTAEAQTGPVEITRTGVSLTILSQPPDWDSYGSLGPGQGTPHMAQRGFQTLVQSDQLGWQGQVTLPTLFTYVDAWPGLALVRDQRVIRNVRPGETDVRFTDVPAGIWPDSVRLRCLDDRPPLKVLEQNYQYDLASASAVLERHVEETITAVFADGRTVRGTLLSFDDGSLVIRPDVETVGGVPVLTEPGAMAIARRELAAVAFEKLPDGLLTTPTLLWKLDNPGRETKRQFEVAYLTTGLFWRADYVLKLHPGGRPTTQNAFLRNAAKRDAESEIRNPKSEMIDRADLVGYATVVNNSGVTYKDAQLKLMAGDVNLLIRPRPLWGFVVGGDSVVVSSARQFQPQMVEKAFFEYHLYTLTRPTDIADNETKQLEMVSGSGLALRRGYVYDPDDNPTAPRLVSEMENTEANGLGKPLPKGVVRLYAPDPEGVSTYVSQTTIDHTPVKEKLRLPWGHAFDIACSRRETDARHSGMDHRFTVEYSLRNHKDRDVTVTVIVRVPASTYAASCPLPWHVREVGLVEVTADVPAGKETRFTFTYRYNDVSGGGLKGPDQASGAGH